MSTTQRPTDSAADALAIDAGFVAGLLRDFIADGVRKVGFGRVVVGLSGGVDSSLVTALAVSSLGAANVVPIFMPYSSSDPQSSVDAHAVCASLGITARIIEITPRSTSTSSGSPTRTHPAGQQDGARADDDPLRPFVASGARCSAPEQDGAAAGVRHAVRRHGERPEPDRRHLQDPGVLARAVARASAERARPSLRARTSGPGRRTRRSSGFATRSSTRSCSCSSTSGRNRAEVVALGFRCRHRRHGGRARPGESSTSAGRR